MFEQQGSNSRRNRNFTSDGIPLAFVYLFPYSNWCVPVVSIHSHLRTRFTVLLSDAADFQNTKLVARARIELAFSAYETGQGPLLSTALLREIILWSKVCVLENSRSRGCCHSLHLSPHTYLTSENNRCEYESCRVRRIWTYNLLNPNQARYQITLALDTTHIQTLLKKKVYFKDLKYTIISVRWKDLAETYLEDTMQLIMCDCNKILRVCTLKST